MANKPEIRKRKNAWWKKRGKSTQNKPLSEKERRGKRNVSEQRDKGWIHVIRVHDTIHSADNKTAGQHTLTNYSTQRKNERLVKHRAYPPYSYIVTERHNSRNKRASREKNNNSEWQEPATSPNPNPRRPRNR